MLLINNNTWENNWEAWKSTTRRGTVILRAPILGKFSSQGLDWTVRTDKEYAMKIFYSGCKVIIATIWYTIDLYLMSPKLHISWPLLSTLSLFDKAANIIRSKFWVYDEAQIPKRSPALLLGKESHLSFSFHSRNWAKQNKPSYQEYVMAILRVTSAWIHYCQDPSLPALFKAKHK